MDAAELASHREQLTQVNDALSLDPGRQDLLDLKEELENLIALTEELLGQQKSSSSSGTAAGTKRSAPEPTHDAASASTRAGPSSGAATPAAKSGSSGRGGTWEFNFMAGDECSAKYSDGKWYPARVTSIGGSALNRVYSIVFKGYNTTEQVTSADIKPTKETLMKRLEPQMSPEEEAALAKKKRKTEKKVEKAQVKTAEAKEKQAAWQKFATKGAKKGYAIPGAKGKSMFATPDDPLSKVGVVGAGRGMTSTSQRTKHIYNED